MGASQSQPKEDVVDTTIQINQETPQESTVNEPQYAQVDWFWPIL